MDVFPLFVGGYGKFGFAYINFIWLITAIMDGLYLTLGHVNSCVLFKIYRPK